MIQFFNGSYLTWQSQGGPEAPTVRIFVSNVITDEVWTVQSAIETAALVLPITIEEQLYFGMVVNYMSPNETTFMCSIPLEELGALSE